MKIRKFCVVLAVMIFMAKQAVFSEEGTATLIRTETPQSGVTISAIVPAPDNRGIFFGVGGSVVEYNNDLTRIGVVASVESSITALALTKNGDSLAIGTEHNAIIRYKRQYYWSSTYDTGALRLGQTANPVTGLAFDPSGSYLMTTDTQRTLLYLHKDNSSGNGTLIGIYGPRAAGIMSYNDSMLFLQHDKIIEQNFVWHQPSSNLNSLEQPVVSEQGPVKQGTETIILAESVICASYNEAQNILYFVKEERGFFNLYKYNLATKQATLFYQSQSRINSVASTDYDTHQVFIAVDDSVWLLRDEFVTITINNQTGIPFNLHFNNTQVYIDASQTPVELVRKPGHYSISASSSTANIYFDGSGETITSNLANHDTLNITALRRFPLTLNPVNENIIPPYDAAINNNNTTRAVGVSHNRNYFISVLDTRNNKQLYRLNFTNTEKIPFLFHNNSLLIANKNTVNRYTARTGELEATYEISGDVIFLDAYGNKLLALSSNSAEIIETNTGKRWSLLAENDSYDMAKFINEYEFIVSGERNVEKFRIDDQEQLIHTQRIPRSWLGSSTLDIIPMGNDGAFSILTKNLKLQSYTGDPDVVEPISHQFNNNLEYQYSYKSNNGLTYLKFLNKSSSRIEDFDAALPSNSSNTFSIARNVLSVRGSQSTNFLVLTNDSVIAYNNNTISGRYYFFNDLSGAYILPASDQRNNDRFTGISDDFDPVKHLRIRQNTTERVFTEQDISSTRLSP